MSSKDIQDLLIQNKLEEAKAHCANWLEKEPDSDEAMNCAGLVAVKTGDLLQAIRYFNDALKKNPENTVYHNNISNAYLSLGHIEEAKQHLYQALNLSPNHAESYNNLGRLYYKQCMFLDAIKYFEKALRINPDYFEAHYNLAHSFAMQNQMERSAVHYREALRIMPNHKTAHFNLGLIYYEQKDFENAVVHLKKAHELMPNDVTAVQYLGHAELSLGHAKESIDAFEKALSLAPFLSDAHHNLAILYLRQEKKETALKHFEEALDIDPNNDTARHMIMALKGAESKEAPKHYISELFDQYADYYNAHVKEKLHYTVPGMLRAAVGRCIAAESKPAHAGRVLDLGCGTGLCGVYFRDLAIDFIGVDLSPKMVEKALLLGAYESVVVADMNDFLAEHHEPFDLIIAGDVLVYQGDLSSLFQAITASLLPQGRFAFTTEHLEAGDYFLKQTGRFAHSPVYIHALAEKNNLEVELEESITPREHEGKAIKGDLFVLRKRLDP